MLKRPYLRGDCEKTGSEPDGSSCLELAGEEPPETDDLLQPNVRQSPAVLRDMSGHCSAPATLASTMWWCS
jgi:hypothetical protein